MTLPEAQAEMDDGAATDAVFDRAGPSTTEIVPAALPTGDALREQVRDIMEARGLSQDATAREMGRSASALNQWFFGKYKGDVAGFEADAQKWLARNADAEAMGIGAGDEPRWTETPAAKAYIATLRYAQAMRKIGVIYGTSGTGKSRAVAHFAAMRPNVKVMTASPAEKTLVPFLKRLARGVGIARPKGGASELTDEIIDKIRGTGGLLIVDEADHLSITAIEQLRYIHDACSIGVVLVGNDTVYSQLTGGARVTELARLYSRVGKRQRAACLPADVDALAKSMGVAGRDEIAFLREIGKRPGHLRNVVQVIQQASIRASGKGEALTREHLEIAWANLGAEV